MENRSPYVLIGAAVMVFIAALAGFVVWKLRAGDDTAYAYYTVLFSGTELWGPEGDSNSDISIDAWESYLEFA